MGSIKMKIINIMGTLAGFAALVLTMNLLAETPVEPKEKHPSAHSQVCWYVTKYYDINGDLITSSAKETDCKDITPTVHGNTNTSPMSTPEAAEAMARIFGQTAPTTSTMGTNSIIISATSTTQ
jgi:hypothetical protein